MTTNFLHIFQNVAGIVMAIFFLYIGYRVHKENELQKDFKKNMK